MTDFDGVIAHHDSPGVDDYPTFDVEIVSPELPCGSAWLVNCLLELQVPIWKPWNMRIDREWERLDNRCYRYSNTAHPLRHILPALALGRSFEFLQSPTPRVFHYWPGFYEPVRKTIFFCRDPRDALYSVWRRVLTSGSIAPDTPFVQFIDSSYFHYPLSWSEYQSVFLDLWKAWLSGREHLILKYEDYRADPMATLRRAVDFLGVSVNDVDLRRATEASSFEHLHRIESASIAQGDTATRVNRAGIPNEHRHTFDATMNAAFDRRYDAVFEWLGYDANPIRNAPDTFRTLDTDRILAAMRFKQAKPAFQTWLRENVAHAANGG